jgi:hypothetical protein
VEQNTLDEERQGTPLEQTGGVESSLTPPLAPVTAHRRSGLGRWMVRLLVIFLFVQLALWFAVGRRGLTRMAPEMIINDISSVVGMGGGESSQPTALRPRVYVISDRLVSVIGSSKYDRLERSLGLFNGLLLATNEDQFIERSSTDGCGDCLFVGLRQTLNTPFFSRSYTSYTRPRAFAELHGFTAISQEREHLHIFVLGRWVPIRSRWIVG